MFNNSDQFSKLIIDLVKPTESIIAGLSGGPDSVFLTYLLNESRAERQLTLHLAHVNYRLRGAESDEDEKFCRSLAGQLKLPIEVKVCDLSSLKDTSGNLQAAARAERMSFFDQLLAQYNSTMIALGHTRDDNVETVLGNIIRGCGLTGLTGMAVKSGKIIRPLLNLSKIEILDFLKRNEIAFRLDSSNLETDYYRNKIRNILIPSIESDFNPQFGNAVLRLSQLARQAVNFIDGEITQFIATHVKKSWLGSAVIELEGFRDLADILKGGLLKKVSDEIARQPREGVAFDLIQSAMKIMDARTGTRFDLGAGVMLEKGSNCLVVFKSAMSMPPQKAIFPGRLTLPGYDLVLNSQMIPKSQVSGFPTDNWSVMLDMDKLMEPMLIRQFQEGDCFRPLGMPGPVKLADFLANRKMPRALRHEIPLLASSGEIAWVIGEEIGEDYKITERSSRILKLWVEKVVKNDE